MLILLPAGPRTVRRAGWAWALVALPPALFVVLAGIRTPAMALFVLSFLLGLSAALMHALAARRPSRRWMALLLWAALLGGTRWMVQHGAVPRLPGSGVAVGLMTALPLADAPGAARSLLDDLVLHAPLVTALSPPLDVRPLDRLDAASLAPLRALLLAQPRQLAPAELVALDRWVRDGGRAVILADPLLRWPDPRPFGDPRRAPLTSLLDPLLAHWGLVLEPADLAAAGASERRVLGDGATVRLATASRFTAAPGSPCRLAEQGLVALCPVGRGQAWLVADGDWLNDAQWTADPARPRDRTAWTSDAVPILSHFLLGGGNGHVPGWTWLQDEKQLISGLRWALAMTVAIGVAGLFLAFTPIFTHAEGIGKATNRVKATRGDPD